MLKDCVCSQACSLSLSALVKQNFASIFAGLLLLHSFGTQAEQHRAATVLQGNMLMAAQLTEDERDNLIRRHMVSLADYQMGLPSLTSISAYPLGVVMLLSSYQRYFYDVTQLQNNDDLKLGVQSLTS